SNILSAMASGHRRPPLDHSERLQFPRVRGLCIPMLSIRCHATASTAALTSMERAAVGWICCGSGARSGPLAVSAVTLPGLDRGLGRLPHILGEGASEVVAFLELAIRIAPHQPLVAIGCNQFTLAAAALGRHCRSP